MDNAAAAAGPRASFGSIADLMGMVDGPRYSRDHRSGRIALLFRGRIRANHVPDGVAGGQAPERPRVTRTALLRDLRERVDTAV
jgi:hypothetical protein